MSDNGVYGFSEISTTAARDVWLYLFQRDSAIWCYTSADRDILIDVGDGNGQQRYHALAISDGGVKQSGEATADDVTITAPSEIPVVQMFRGTPPSGNVGVVIRRLQFGDTDAPITWAGYVSSVKYKDGVASEIVCNTEVASVARKGLRKSWERGCNHALYDDGCGLNPADWSTKAIIDTLDGDTLTLTLVTVPPPFWYSEVTSPFANGYVEWNPDPGYTERRGIQTHTKAASPGNGDTCYMLNQTDGLAVGQSVTVVSGCQRVPSNCLVPFNNIASYGGFAFLPGKSPFDGDPVF